MTYEHLRLLFDAHLEPLPDLLRQVARALPEHADVLVRYAESDAAANEKEIADAEVRASLWEADKRGGRTGRVARAALMGAPRWYTPEAVAYGKAVAQHVKQGGETTSWDHFAWPRVMAAALDGHKPTRQQEQLYVNKKKARDFAKLKDALVVLEVRELIPTYRRGESLPDHIELPDSDKLFKREWRRWYGLSHDGTDKLAARLAELERAFAS